MGAGGERWGKVAWRRRVAGWRRVVGWAGQRECWCGRVARGLAGWDMERAGGAG